MINKVFQKLAERKQNSPVSQVYYLCSEFGIDPDEMNEALDEIQKEGLARIAPRRVNSKRKIVWYYDLRQIGRYMLGEIDSLSGYETSVKLVIDLEIETQETRRSYGTLYAGNMRGFNDRK